MKTFWKWVLRFFSTILLIGVIGGLALVNFFYPRVWGVMDDFGESVTSINAVAREVDSLTEQAEAEIDGGLVEDIMYAVTYVDVPQVVRLVDLVTLPGTVILNGVGDLESLTVLGFYSDQTYGDIDDNLINFYATDPSVVEVSEGGLVRAVGPGSSDIILEFGRFNKRVHALVFDEYEPVPPVDPSMVGNIPGLQEEVPAVLNRVIVELSPGYGDVDAANIASELGGESIFSFRTFPGYIIEFDTQSNQVLDVLAYLESDYRVESASPDMVVEPLGHPIDTLSGDNSEKSSAYEVAGFDNAWRIMENIDVLNPVVIWVFENDPMYFDDPDAPAVFKEEFDAERIHVANPSIRLPKSEDEPVVEPAVDWHAAAVTGVVAARNHYGQGRNPEDNVSGIVSSVENLPYDIIALNIGDTELLYSSILRELDIVDSVQADIDIVNISWGIEWEDEDIALGPLNIDNRTPERYGLIVVKRVITEMVSVTFAVAAGNDARDADLQSPSRYSPTSSNVITVGGAAHDKGNLTYMGRHYDSNYGRPVTIAAPYDVWTIDISTAQGYKEYGGTSLSAPMVSGAAALLKAIDPDLTPEDVKHYLVDTGEVHDICTTTDDPCDYDDTETWSFLRADRAIAKLLSDRVRADIGDRLIVPLDDLRVSGEHLVVGFEVQNHGDIAWTYHVESVIRRPDGREVRLHTSSAEVAVAPGAVHQYMGGFWATEPGCWDLGVRVWIDGGDSRYIRDALADLNPNSNIPHGLLATMSWEEAIEVRDSNSPDKALDCPGAGDAIPFLQMDELGDDPGQLLATPGYNVLLLADTSGSMDGGKLTALKEALNLFINEAWNIQLEAKFGTVIDPSNIGMVDFDGGYRQVMPLEPIDPSGDLEDWHNAVRRLDSDGGTALYDSIIRAVSDLEEQSQLGRPNILIALTDGEDADSRNSISSAISALEGSSVTLYALALSETGGGGDYDFQALERLANANGGAAYAANTDDLSGLYRLFSTIFALQ